MAEDTEHEYEAPVDVEALGWNAPEPPDGFAERVVASMAEEAAEEDRPRAERRARPLWIAGIVGVAAAALLWVVTSGLFFGGSSEAVSDSLIAEEIETVAIRDRAIAVAQPGTQIRWEVDSDGTARIEQDTGRVFYRVDDGGPFRVQTPAGTVTVTGTCFEVDLTSPQEERMKKQGLKAGATVHRSARSLRSGALGAALASAVFVTVYEGQVVLANERGEVTVDPGQSARASTDRTPTRWGTDESSPQGTGGAKALPAGVDPVATLRRQAQELERIRAEKLAQTEQIESLQAQVEALGGTPTGELTPEARKARAKKCASQSRGGDCPFLEPDQDTLEEMARCATVKYDHPGFVNEIDPPQTEDYAGRLGLTDPAELQGFQAAAEKHHAAYNDSLRELYIELGGSEELAEESSAKALEAFIEDQLDHGLAGEVQRKIAEERAGVREPPAREAELPLEERFWRQRAELGNDFERHVSDALGSERARELRSVNDGWPGSTSRHSGDCR